MVLLHERTSQVRSVPDVRDDEIRTAIVSRGKNVPKHDADPRIQMESAAHFGEPVAANGAVVISYRDPFAASLRDSDVSGDAETFRSRCDVADRWVIAIDLEGTSGAIVGALVYNDDFGFAIPGGQYRLNGTDYRGAAIPSCYDYGNGRGSHSRAARKYH